MVSQCMLTIGMNITERRRREQVQDATYQISRVLLNDAELPGSFRRAAPDHRGIDAGAKFLRRIAQRG